MTDEYTGDPADADKLILDGPPGPGGSAEIVDSQGRKVDPELLRQHLITITGKGGKKPYMTVPVRLLWFRREHPNGQILTSHIKIDETIAIFQARITTPDGGESSGYGSETPGDFGDYIEKAETKAIGRALNHLGYGIEDMEGDATPVDSGMPAPTRQRPQEEPKPARKPETRGEANATIQGQIEREGLKSPNDFDPQAWARVVGGMTNVGHACKAASIAPDHAALEVVVNAVESKGLGNAAWEAAHRRAVQRLTRE